MANLEFVQGQESHSSYWGKFYVKGLEQWQVKEDFPENQQTKHNSYQGYTCLDIPEQTVFSVFYQDGDKRGTDNFYFAICCTSHDYVEKIIQEYTGCWIEGNLKIIAKGEGKVKAPRLMKWWIDSTQKTLEFAEHCAKYIDKRGIKELPPL